MEKRRKDKIVFEREIVTDDPNTFMNLKLELEGINEEFEGAARRVFVAAWERFEEVYKEASPQ